MLTAFKQYQSTNNALTFAVTADGKGGFYNYCEDSDCGVMGTYEAVQKCEERTGRKCYVYAELGKIIGKNIVPNGGSENFARFSVSRFGITDTTVYVGNLFDPENNREFTLEFDKNNQCNGKYGPVSGISVILECDVKSKKVQIENGTFFGNDEGFTWRKGGSLILRKIGSSQILEMKIFPYLGTACETHAGKYSKTDGTTPESFATADMMLALCKQCVRDGGTDCY